MNKKSLKKQIRDSQLYGKFVILKVHFVLFELLLLIATILEGEGVYKKCFKNQTVSNFFRFKIWNFEKHDFQKQRDFISNIKFFPFSPSLSKNLLSSKN